MALETMTLWTRTSKKNHASQNLRQTAIVFCTEFVIFMVLETMALWTRISEKNHDSQNRRQTNMVSRTELMIFMVLETMTLCTRTSEKNHASKNRRQTDRVSRTADMGSRTAPRQMATSGDHLGNVSFHRTLGGLQIC